MQLNTKWYHYLFDQISFPVIFPSPQLIPQLVYIAIYVAAISTLINEGFNFLIYKEAFLQLLNSKFVAPIQKLAALQKILKQEYEVMDWEQELKIIIGVFEVGWV